MPESSRVYPEDEKASPLVLQEEIMALRQVKLRKNLTSRVADFEGGLPPQLPSHTHLLVQFLVLPDTENKASIL